MQAPGGRLALVARTGLAGLDETLDLVHEAHVGFDLREHALVGNRRPALGVQARDQLALTEYQRFRMRNRRMRVFGLRQRHPRTSNLGQRFRPRVFSLTTGKSSPTVK